MMKETIYIIIFNSFIFINKLFGKIWRDGFKRRVNKLTPYWGQLRFFFHVFQFEKFGTHCSIGSKFTLLGNPEINLGQNVTIRNNIQIGGSGTLKIDDNTTINDYTLIACMKNISIGKNVMIAPYVYILDVDHKFENSIVPIASQGYIVEEVIIGDDVWIGTNTIITKGVTIADGVIVGANSVVTKNLEFNGIYAGSPARLIRKR